MIPHRKVFAWLWLASLLLISALPAVSLAQPQEDCGIVDAISYPVDGISIEHDDFGMYRSIFNGYHAGIDMAFGRYGEPIRAAARGRVTFSDPEGWDTEKGVVVIEHNFPDGSTYFSLYGHMEELNGHRFPRVGACVRIGDIVGAVGRPNLSASHLHYEIRRMRASTGGPGYWSTDPLDGGWMHPIEFTERWRLRLSPAYRGMISATAPLVAPPLWLDGDRAIFAATYQIEERAASGETHWQLSVKGLQGLVPLPDGRVLAQALRTQMVVVENGRFVAAWQAALPLKSAPMRIGESIVFLTEDNRVVSYTGDGTLRWQTEPLGPYLEYYVPSGDLLAIAGEREGTHHLWVVNAAGQVVYQGTAPSPVVPAAAPYGGFLIMVATQISLLGPDLNLRPLIDTGLALSRNSQATFDGAGNIYLYPGHGQDLYAYAPDGALRWRARLSGSLMQPPLLGVGAGCIVYGLTFDGSLLAYRASDGSLRGIATLYGGRQHGNEAARFLRVLPDDQVQFSAGYLTIATLDGPTLANMDNCRQS